MLRRAGGVMAAAVAAVAVVGYLVASPARADTATDEQHFVAQINDLRASKGLAPLVVHVELTRIGRAWAAEMARVGAISHNANFPNQVQADWGKLGENVGVGGSVDSLMKAFINSPSHYANLVDGAYTHVGVGVVHAADGRMYTSHQFMKLRFAAPAPTVPTAAPKPATAWAPTPAAAKPAGAVPAATPKPAAKMVAKAHAPAASKPSSASGPKALSARLKFSLEQLSDLDPAA